MESENQTLSHYLHNGTPYIKELILPDITPNNDGKKITVGDREYFLGDDKEIIIAKRTTGKPQDWVRSIAEGVNANAKKVNVHTISEPSIFAYCKPAGNRVIFFGRRPGDDFILTSDITGVTINTLVSGIAPAGLSASDIVDDAPDVVNTFAYGNNGGTDYYVTSIVASSVLTGTSYTDTFAYADPTDPVDRRVTTITRS